MRKILLVTLLMLLSLTIFSMKNDVVFSDIDIKEALRQLSNIYNVSIIFPEDLEGNVSISLYDVSLETALNVILSNFNYSFEKVENMYVVITSRTMEYYKPHVYTPKFKNPNEISELLPFPSYAIGDDIVIYCTDKTWDKYYDFLKKIDNSSGRSKIVTYLIYYVENDEVSRFNITSEDEFFELFSEINKANYILNTHGFLVGNDIESKVDGNIALDVAVNDEKIKINMLTENDSAKLEIPFVEGITRKVLDGSFGKFVVLVNTKEISNIQTSKKSTIYNIQKIEKENLLGIGYYTDGKFELNISTKDLTILFEKSDKYIAGATFNPINNFKIGGLINIEDLKDFSVILEDTFEIKPLFMILEIKSPLDFSNINLASLFELAYINAGLGIEQKLKDGEVINAALFLDSSENISWRLKIYFGNFGIGFWGDQKLKFGGSLYIKW